jgi:hypothetical protein
MNEITLLREAGPEAPPLTSAARSSARAALLSEIDGTRGTRFRRRRSPSRKLQLRIGVGLVTAAAAWATAVVVAGPDSPGTPAESVRLVDFVTPTFPLSLDPAPVGLRPAFDGGADGASFADYRDADGTNGFTISVREDEPDIDEINLNADTGPVEEVEVDGVDADLVRGSRDVSCEDGLSVCGSRDFAQLSFEFEDDAWVFMEGDGIYHDPERLIEVAGSLVARPQPATLSVGLAPEGWSVQFFKMGRVLTLVNDSYEQQTMNVHIPLPEDVIPADQVRASIMGPVGPQLEVTVHGRPAQLVLCESGYLEERLWFLQAQFEDGTTFVLQVPDAFTQEQVLELAGTVTYNP